MAEAVMQRDDCRWLEFGLFEFTLRQCYYFARRSGAEVL